MSLPSTMLTRAIATLLATSPAVAATWSHVGGSSARTLIPTQLAPPLTTSDRVLSQDADGDPITFVGQSMPVTDAAHVYVLGASNGQAKIYAANRGDGSIAWESPIPAPFFDSFSSPTLDEANNAVVVASGFDVIAFDCSNGAEQWRTTLAMDIVNASPAITDDLGDADRLFITDYDGFGFVGGNLYCINVDPFDAATNPWQPGDIVWTVAMGDATSGNSPAYHDGVVYAASAGGFFGRQPGKIRAWDATATTSPPALWTFTNSISEGFYGGVSVVDDGSDTYVYGATYAFFGGLESANLVKINATTGQLAWSHPCNRTQSIPIPTGDGRVLLSTGYPGDGSVPSLQCFDDHGTHASLRWCTALSTWDDTNSNGFLELGEFLLMGGWTHQPIVVQPLAGGCFAYVGAVQTTGLFDASTDLRLIDVDLSPAAPGFEVEHHAPCGSSPALLDGVLYSIGPNGLCAFGLPTPTPMFDVDTNGDVDIRDLYAWESMSGLPDVDGNGTIDATDRIVLITELRANEPDDIGGNRGIAADLR